MCIKLFNWCQLAAFAARFSPLLLLFLALALRFSFAARFFSPSLSHVYYVRRVNLDKTLASDTVCNQVENSDLHGVTPHVSVDPPSPYAHAVHTHHTKS